MEIETGSSRSSCVENLLWEEAMVLSNSDYLKRIFCTQGPTYSRGVNNTLTVESEPVINFCVASCFLLRTYTKLNVNVTPFNKKSLIM